MKQPDFPICKINSVSQLNCKRRGLSSAGFDYDVRHMVVVRHIFTQ